MEKLESKLPNQKKKISPKGLLDNIDFLLYSAAASQYPDWYKLKVKMAFFFNYEFQKKYQTRRLTIYFYMEYSLTIKQILLVEDDQTLSKMYQDQLLNGGFEVFLAHDEKEEFDQTLIILDVAMPKMNGMAILDELGKDIWKKC